MTTTGRPALLLVDDRTENLLALEAALAPLGLRLVTARSGEQALAHLLKDEFVAIVLDVQMPGLDGFETAAAIKSRERTRDVPIIFLTAIGRDDAHRMRGYDTGAVDYIMKPVDPDLLRARVRVFVELALKERELRATSDRLAATVAALERSNADLEQFAYIASHDLQEPLRVVAGHLELIAERAGDALDGQAREWMARATRAAARMERLLDDLLTYSRAATGSRRREAVALRDAVDDALESVGRLVEERRARIDVAADLPVVEAERGALSRVVQNLIANAVTHAARQEARVRIGAVPGDGVAVVTVEDDGPGIPAADRDRAFGMFERLGHTPYPGSGLGLAICRRIVSELGGRIWIDDSDLGGAAVRFTVPCP